MIYNNDRPSIIQLDRLSQVKDMSLKDAKVNFLVDMATDLFMSRSIQEVTIRDIAISAQVGEATIYRYFGKKQELVVQAAMKLQGIVSSGYFQLDSKMNGYQKLETFYLSYLDIFNHHRDFYKFLSEFDSYMSVENKDVLNPYEDAIDQYKSAFMNAYEQGLKDGSVKEQANIDLFYFSTTHSILELCKKLALKAVLNQDLAIEKLGEVRCLIDIVLNTLKK